MTVGRYRLAAEGRMQALRHSPMKLEVLREGAKHVLEPSLE